MNNRTLSQSIYLRWIEDVQSIHFRTWIFIIVLHAENKQKFINGCYSKYRIRVFVKMKQTFYEGDILENRRIFVSLLSTGEKNVRKKNNLECSFFWHATWCGPHRTFCVKKLLMIKWSDALIHFNRKLVSNINHGRYVYGSVRYDSVWFVRTVAWWKKIVLHSNLPD